MEKTAVQELARALRIMVTVLIVCNVIALFLSPAIVLTAGERYPGDIWGFVEEFFLQIFHARPLAEDDIDIPLIFAVLVAWWEVTQYPTTAFFTVFFLVCGGCTLVILFQARHILDTILAGRPFQLKNARSLNRAALCCWVISGATLVRLGLELVRYKSRAPLYTYNTLFVPLFLMAGLLFQVMSALFRQAAELKEDQDLTI